jgi:trehalose 6-phosphate phosphatase
MTAAELRDRLQRHLRTGGQLWLFLDYDGTLVPIAPTPDQARPDAELLVLLAGLARHPAMRVAILSGRSLATLQAFLPVPGLILAGLYGAEVQFPGEAGPVLRAPREAHAVAAQVKAAWAELVAGRTGFLVEDKGLAIALHARFAEAAEADGVLSRARAAAESAMPAAGYRLLDGERFLEIAPAVAHKGWAVRWLLEVRPLADGLPVYFGDDDKDEAAFAEVLAWGGLTVAVGPRALSHASARLPSPGAARQTLRSVLEAADGWAADPG